MTDLEKQQARPPTTMPPSLAVLLLGPVEGDSSPYLSEKNVLLWMLDIPLYQLVFYLSLSVSCLMLDM